MSTLLRGVFTALAVAFLITGCTGNNPSSSPAPSLDSSSAPEVNPAVPENYREAAVAYATFRTIDACGLHDVAAAQTAGGGDKGDEIVPSDDGLHECVLRLNKGEFDPTWTLHLEVGASFDSGRRHQAAREQLGGMEVFTSEEEDSCLLAKPLDDTYVIELRIQAPSKSTKTACAFGREYVAALAPLWQDPPHRGSGRTTPELPLGLMDPCVAAAAVLPELGQGAQLKPTAPYTCKAEPAAAGKPAVPSKGQKAVTQDITVEYILTEDPLDKLDAVAKTVKIRATKIGDRAATIREDSLGCKTTVVWDSQTTIVVDGRADTPVASMQAITIRTPSCDTAQATAEKILAAAVKR